MSATQSWFGRAAVKSRSSRSRARPRPGPARWCALVAPRTAPASPCLRISRSTVQRATVDAARGCSWRHTLRAP